MNKHPSSVLLVATLLLFLIAVVGSIKFPKVDAGEVGGLVFESSQSAMLDVAVNGVDEQNPSETVADAAKDIGTSIGVGLLGEAAQAYYQKTAIKTVQRKLTAMGISVGSKTAKIVLEASKKMVSAGKTAAKAAKAGTAVLGVASNILGTFIDLDKVCYKRSYGRGVGKPVSTCPSNSAKDGLLCYPRCDDGYYGVGPVCWAYCRSGYHDDGALCRRDASVYKASKNCPWYDVCGLTFAKGCSSCPNGGRHDGCFCWFDVHIYAKSSYGRTAGVPMSCKTDEEGDGGLCYPFCDPGYYGVGPVCWMKCPPDRPYACGAFCAESQAVCGGKLASYGIDVLNAALSAVTMDVAGVVSTGVGSIIDLATIPLCNEPALSADQMQELNTPDIGLQAKFKDFGQEYAGSKYTKVGNICVVEGLISTSSADPNNKNFLNLPEDCRPVALQVFSGNENEGFARIDFRPGGQAMWATTSGPNGWFSISGMAFPTSTGTNLELLNGWKNYGGEFQTAQYTKLGSLCFVYGVIAGSASTGAITVLPAECRPKLGGHVFYLNQHTRLIRVQAYPTGLIEWIAGTNADGWISLSGIIFDTEEPVAIAPVYPNFGGGYAPFGYSKHGPFCVLSGALAVGSGNVIARLPADCRPYSRQVFHTGQQDHEIRVDILQDGSLIYAAGANRYGYIHLSGIIFATTVFSPISSPIQLQSPVVAASPSTVEYSRQGDICTLQGQVNKNGGNVIGVLPIECRPADGVLVFNGNVADRMARVDIDTRGIITHVATLTGSNNWLSLDGISFSVLPGIPLALSPGSLNYGYGLRSARYIVQGGVCYVSGLIATGGGLLMVLPADCRPSKTHIFTVNYFDRTIRVDVDPFGNVVWQAGSDRYEWVSLNGITFPVSSQTSTLTSFIGYQNYGAPFAHASYYKAEFTCVLSGVLKGSGYDILTLPPACRPVQRVVTITTQNNKAPISIEILPSGKVGVTSIPADGWVSLSGIAFATVVRGTPASVTALSIAGIWAENSGRYWSATQQGNDVVLTQGSRVSRGTFSSSNGVFSAVMTWAPENVQLNVVVQDENTLLLSNGDVFRRVDPNELFATVGTWSETNGRYWSASQQGNNFVLTQGSRVATGSWSNSNGVTAAIATWKGENTQLTITVQNTNTLLLSNGDIFTRVSYTELFSIAGTWVENSGRYWSASGSGVDFTLVQGTRVGTGSFRIISGISSALVTFSPENVQLTMTVQNNYSLRLSNGDYLTRVNENQLFSITGSWKEKSGRIWVATQTGNSFKLQQDSRTATGTFSISNGTVSASTLFDGSATLTIVVANTSTLVLSNGDVFTRV